MTGTIDRSVAKIHTYQALDTIKIETSNMGENRNQILSHVVFSLYSLGGILQECFSGQKPMSPHFGMKYWLTV